MAKKKKHEFEGKPVGTKVRSCPGDDIEVVEVTDFLGEAPAMLKALANYIRKTRDGEPVYVTVETHFRVETGEMILMAFIGGRAKDALVWEEVKVA